MANISEIKQSGDNVLKSKTVFDYKTNAKKESIFKKAGIDCNNDGVIDFKEAHAYTSKKSPKEKISNYLKDYFKIADGDVSNLSQGNYGSCWLLAPVYAIGESKNGTSLIKQLVKQNENGSLTVTFYGQHYNNLRHWQTTFSNDELSEFMKTPEKHSSSDPDSAAIELAFLQYQKSAKISKENYENWVGGMREKINDFADTIPQEDLNKNEKIYAFIEKLAKTRPDTFHYEESTEGGLEGNSISYALNVMIGYEAPMSSTPVNPEDIDSEFKDFEKPPKNRTTIGVVVFKNQPNKNIQDNHAYAVKQKTFASLLLKNPWSAQKASESIRIKNIEDYDGLYLTKMDLPQNLDEHVNKN